MSARLVPLLSFALALLPAVPSHGAANKSSDACRPGGGAQMADTSAIVTDDFLSEMRAIGVTTIARYYDHPDETIVGKRLRKSELALLKRHGMSLVVVFQHNNNRPETFNDWRNRGPADAAAALKLADEFGQPPNGAIYFGVDGDFVGPGALFHTDDVIGYFEEVNATFDAAGVSYPVGVYGSGETCATLFAEGLAGFCWLSHSHGFSGTPDALEGGWFDIEQFLPAPCGGREVDLNRLRDGVTAFGQWTPE